MTFDASKFIIDNANSENGTYIDPLDVNISDPIALSDSIGNTVVKITPKSPRLRGVLTYYYGRENLADVLGGLSINPIYLINLRTIHKYLNQILGIDIEENDYTITAPLTALEETMPYSILITANQYSYRYNKSIYMTVGFNHHETINSSRELSKVGFMPLNEIIYNDQYFSYNDQLKDLLRIKDARGLMETSFPLLNQEYEFISFEALNHTRFSSGHVFIEGNFLYSVGDSEYTAAGLLLSSKGLVLETYTEVDSIFHLKSDINRTSYGVLDILNEDVFFHRYFIKEDKLVKESVILKELDGYLDFFITNDGVSVWSPKTIEELTTQDDSDVITLHDGYQLKHYTFTGEIDDLIAPTFWQSEYEIKIFDLTKANDNTLLIYYQLLNNGLVDYSTLNNQLSINFESLELTEGGSYSPIIKLTPCGQWDKSHQNLIDYDIGYIHNTLPEYPTDPIPLLHIKDDIPYFLFYSINLKDKLGYYRWVKYEKGELKFINGCYPGQHINWISVHDFWVTTDSIYTFGYNHNSVTQQDADILTKLSLTDQSEIIFDMEELSENKIPIPML